MTDRDVVERVGSLWRRAVLTLRTRQEHHKVPYATTLKGSSAAELMTVVSPFMGIARQAQIAIALAMSHGRPPRWQRSVGTCTAPSCGNRALKRGLCKKHYHSWWKSTRRGRTSKYQPRSPQSPWPDIDPNACTMKCDVAWLAGLLEGEASFGLTGGGSASYPVISIQMCDEDVIERVRTLLGAAAISRREFDNENWNSTFQVKLVGSAAAQWMRTLRPLLGDRRRYAVDAALAAYHPIRLVDPPAICVVSGCGEPTGSRGLCHKHYMSWSRDVAKGRTPRVTPLR